MQMIIANRLTDGRVVFLDDRDGWVDRIDHGVVLDAGQDAERGLHSAQRAVRENLVVDPYLIDVSAENGRPRPIQVRERIRAFGPSVGPAPQSH